jgi:hypothetical protein
MLGPSEAGAVRRFVRFQEYRCDPKRNSGARQDRRKFSLAALDAKRRPVKDDLPLDSGPEGFAHIPEFEHLPTNMPTARALSIFVPGR